jgi:hypothetical protein
MAGPRINQFADDLGINRSSAKKLMKKARGRKDGGSETLEKHMGSVAKPQEAEVKAKDGKYMSCGGMRKAVGGGKFTGVY